MDEHPPAPSARLTARITRRLATRAAAWSLGERLGLPDVRGHAGLLVAVLIDSLGTGLFLPFAVLYATLAARLPVAMTGLLLSLAAAIALPAAPLAGAMADRYGGQRIVIAAHLLQALGFAGYPFIATPAPLFACSLAIAVGNQLYWAANGAFIADLAPPAQRARWFALLGACRSAGLGGGALLSGLAIVAPGASGYRLLAGLNALSFCCAALLIARIAPHRHGRAAASPKSHPEDGSRRESLRQRALSVWYSIGEYRAVFHDRPFLGFTATNCAFSLVILSSTITLPLYIIGSLRQPASIPGILFAFNTALVVVAQTIVARWSERYRRTHALAFSAALFAGALLLLAGLIPLSRFTAGSGAWILAGLLLAMLVYTAAELIMAPLKNVLVADAAPDALRGRYLAFYHLSWSAASTVAPALLTLLFTLSAGWLWLALAGVAVSALLALIRLDSALPAHAVRPQRAIHQLAANQRRDARWRRSSSG